MQVTLLAVGKLRRAYRELCDEYLRRAGRFVRVVERELRQGAPGGADERQRQEEGTRILAALPAGTPVVLLDQGGEAWTSEELARQVQRWREDARDRIVVVGGAAGVTPSVRERADQVWSLGPLTLPHELARVLVAEQLYRAAAILQGTPYHRGGR